MNAFGVVFQAIVKPEHFEFSSSMKYLRNTINVAYWPIYGELQVLDDIKNQSCSAKDEPCIDDFSYGFIYVLLMIYMIFGHVLLLNLIIAMFRSENDFNNLFYFQVFLAIC